MLILQTTVPDYRKKFFNFLNDNIANFQLFSGEAYFEPSIKTDKSIIYRQPVKNIYLFNRLVLFQTGMWKPALKAGLVVLELNPRIISNWIILVFRRILGKKTIVWGHAWPRNGKNSKSDLVRSYMRRLATSIIVYTKREVKELKQKVPNKSINAAPNALYFKDEIGIESMNNGLLITDLIYVGRLSNDKKVLFLIKAFHRIIIQLPDTAKLIIIGSGEQQELIEKYIEENNLEKKIKLLGHVSDYKILKEQYSTALISVLPGTAGLSLTQSFGFGVPILISKNEKHGPEMEAVFENENALFFEADNVVDLERKILNVYNDKLKWISIREKIGSFCKANYSIESMAKIFINVIETDEIK